VMTTFASLLHQMSSLARVHSPDKHDRRLSILPLNHMFELVGGFLTILWSGGEVCYGDSLFPDDVIRTLKGRRITRMLCVPIFLELVERWIESAIAERSRIERLAFAFKFRVLGRIHSQRFKRLLFRQVRAALGGSLQNFISGGAPLESRTERFFDRIGIPIYQGYGLTETSPVVAANTSRHRRIGSVGRPLPEVELRIEKRHAADVEGEILTRGPHVMAGYRGGPDLTAEALDSGGWLRTGDLGHIDADGFLFITGRAKSLIVLGTGKKVQPEEVELCLAKSPLVGEICVVGIRTSGELHRGHERVCAVVVPARECSEAEVVCEIRRLARSLATYKRPSAIVVRGAALPRTSTAKLRRDEVVRWACGQERIAS
jgi:long-chain acyl-CoA synthetase